MRWLSMMVVMAGCAAGGGAETDLETGFCDLLRSGPEAEVMATADTAGAPEAALSDTVVEVDLLEDDDGFWGWVAFTADEPGSFAIGVSEDVDVRLVDDQGAEVPAEETIEGAACDQLVRRVTFPLQARTYWLELSGDVAEVDLVSEESDDDL
jgi:hypothetical protein